MRPKKPKPSIEVRFVGGGVLPEAIPLNTLSRAMTAVQRLASGAASAMDDEGDNALSLLTIRRGSADFDCAAASPARATQNLRLTGSFIESPKGAEDASFVFNPLEDLSAIARSLRCTIQVRQSANRDVLATVGPETFNRLADSLLLSGQTTIIGTVERVGGATGMKCSLRIESQGRLLYCDVSASTEAKTRDLVRALGQRLYERVAVSGDARWIKGSWRVLAFQINAMQPVREGGIVEGFAALRNAGGSDWAKVKDPAALLQEVSGDR